MIVTDIIQRGVITAVKDLYGADITADQITMNNTRKEFEGDYTVVTFPFTRIARKKPEVIAEEMGQFLVEKVEEIEQFNVIKGFLNLSLSDTFWKGFLKETYHNDQYGQLPANGKKVMVEFSSPNTNKPLHLGHIRNILLGWSASKIAEAAGYDVVRVQIVNDRGIAICKSMLAWQKYGAEATPDSTGIKSDHFVGKYYVLFEQKFRKEYKDWQSTDTAQSIFENWQQDIKALKKAEKTQEDALEKAKHKAEKAIKEARAEGRNEAEIASLQVNEEDYSLESYFFKSIYKNTYFNEYSSLGQQAKAMLLKWEAGDKDIITLWKQMNEWVYKGFDVTYRELGVRFDKLYYESNTYLLGKDSIAKGLEKGIFYKKEDGSIWIDLTEDKLDHKLVLRSDGTSVYMTQDIGTAQVRYQDFGADKMVYVVADEQNYHFQVLFKILERMGEPYAQGLHHLSYGMVDLPSGKMKSREGTVVDADDLMAEVVNEAKQNSFERDTLSSLSKEEQEDIIYKIGLAALKFFIIKVNPQKRMTFNPAESVDMQGQTGPYVQNAYVRVRSLLRKAGEQDTSLASNYDKIQKQEKEILSQLYTYPELIAVAAEEYDPSTIANFCYELAKNYHRFYHDLSILSAETEAAKAFRLQLSQAVAHVLKHSMDLLGIEMPERM